MLVCVSRYRKSGQAGVYDILDTDDGIVESVGVAEIKAAFGMGLNILGLRFAEGSGVSLDPVWLSSYTDSEGASDAHCKYEKLDNHNAWLFQRRSDKVDCVHIIYADTILEYSYSKSMAMNYVNCSVVDFGVVGSQLFASLELSYHDKHYYEEDCGADFAWNALINKLGVVISTEKYNTRDFWYEDTAIGNATWCSRNMNW